MTRQEAIKVLNTYDVNFDEYTAEEIADAIDMAIEALSAVCDDCIWHVCNYNKIDWEGEDGYISRWDAIRWVKTECNPYGKPTLDFESGKKVIEYLKQMPSADRPTGEWVDIDNYYRMATCSNCHKVTMFEKWGEYTRSYNYCPNCGADMRGEEHGQND